MTASDVGHVLMMMGAAGMLVSLCLLHLASRRQR